MGLTACVESDIHVWDLLKTFTCGTYSCVEGTFTTYSRVEGTMCGTYLEETFKVTHMWKGYSHVGVTHMWKGHFT